MEQLYHGALRFNNDLYFSVKIDTQHFGTYLYIETIEPESGAKVGASYIVSPSDWDIKPINGGE